MRYFDIEALQTWFNDSVKNYEGKPVILSVYYYTKGKKEPFRHSNFNQTTNQEADPDTYTPENGIAWLLQSLNCYAPTGVYKAEIIHRYGKTNTQEASRYPIAFNNPLQNYNNLQQIAGLPNQQPNGIYNNQIGVLQQQLQQQQTQFLEFQKQVELQKKDQEIEELYNYIDEIQKKKLGAIGAVGQIVEKVFENNPNAAESMMIGLTPVLQSVGMSIGASIMELAKSILAKKGTAVGTLNHDQPIDNFNHIQTIEQIFEVQDGKVFLSKLLQYLQANPQFIQMIKSQING